MKRILVVALFGLLAVVMPSAGKKPWKPPEPFPTNQQMQNAYAASVQQMTVLATNPMSIRVDPIEMAWFRRRSDQNGKRVWVEMWVAFYGQNSYGATIRSTAICEFWLLGSDGLGRTLSCYSVSGDGIALGLLPKDMVQITPQKSSDARYTLAPDGGFTPNPLKGCEISRPPMNHPRPPTASMGPFRSENFLLSPISKPASL